MFIHVGVHFENFRIAYWLCLGRTVH